MIFAKAAAVTPVKALPIRLILAPLLRSRRFFTSPRPRLAI